VAAISPAGLATGLAPGASTISAAYLGIAGAAPLSLSPPLVTLTHVDAIEKKHKVTKIVLTFSGALERVNMEQSWFREDERIRILSRSVSEGRPPSPRFARGSKAVNRER
jgi:hypothetical protein